MPVPAARRTRKKTLAPNYEPAPPALGQDLFRGEPDIQFDHAVILS